MARSPPILVDSWPESILPEVASMPGATGELAVPPDPTPAIPPGGAIAVTAEIT